MTVTASTKFAAHCCPILLVVSLICNQLSAASENNENNSSRYQFGVRNSPERPLKTAQLAALLESLRRKSGFQEIHFDKDGFLRLGDRTKLDGGSAVARELLVAAVDRSKAIDLENHDRSSKVAFARLTSSIIFISKATGAQVEVYPIEIDFGDFAHLRGAREVIEAFDIGFVVMHELAHAALGLHDALINGQGPGECEEFINLIRRDLGIPERQNYAAKTFGRVAISFQKPSRLAELIFAYAPGRGRTKPQLLNLNWEAERVGVVRQEEYKPQTISPRSQSSIAP